MKIASGIIASGDNETIKAEKSAASSKGSSEMAKTPRTLSAFYTKMPMLSSGTTSPKYAGMKVVSLMDSNNSHQDFSLKVIYF